MTKTKMYAFFKDFQYDPIISAEMPEKDYKYDKDRVDAYYEKHTEQGKLHYAIMLGDTVIGDIYLKNMDKLSNSCELGIHMVNNYYKGKGYGTQALIALKNIAFRELKLKTLYADTREENRKSCRALSKAGFTKTRQENGRCIFECHADP